MNDQLSVTQQQRFELRFCALYKEGRAYAFPCDSHGHVELDALSEKARCNYLFVRAAVGWEYSLPIVQPVT
ncbi:MAG TPA: hypothetical protein VF169_10650 [Albitalea sp.]|uniref:hypothetical protein n=1 Tax=Piscinibacter sp. TaxID=1903157 RepID=UPI002ED65B93